VRDVIVVGAGAGGPIVAKELAARGLDVLMLEGGPRHPDPEREWSRYENDANNLVDGYFRVGDGDRFDSPAWFRELPQASHLWQVAGVGGTTLHYYANSLRAMPGAFSGYSGADRGRYDTAHPIPISYRSLLPYYEWVEETLPVAPAAMGTKEEVFFRGAQRIGLPLLRGRDATRASYRPQPNAILQPQGTAGRTGDSRRLRYPEARGCTFCGYCFQGCVQPREAPRNLKAKRSTDNSYVPMALTADRWARGGKAVELRADAFVTRIHSERRGSRRIATGVTWRDTASGAHHREDARVVVLAGGCVETPRLWLNSDLPNPNRWVGRGFTDHAFDWVFGVFDEYTGSSKGTGSSARGDYPGHGSLEHVGIPPALQAFTSTFSDSGVRGAYTNGRGVRGPWDGPTGRFVGNALKDVLSNVDRVINIVTLTDDDVEAQNRVVLSSLPGDEHGAVPKVTFEKRRRSRRTLANREFLARRATELIRAAGARRVYRLDWPPLILHVQSTMRMGHRADDSVVRPSGETRAVGRLFVADNSVLPNALGGPNPTLTTQALATRTAEELFVRYFEGDRWVGREAPVVSTDRRVTQGLFELGLA
jgi:choline dehydrogenase-like flavoprotein